MIIKSLEIDGLNNDGMSSVHLEFNDDLTILAGWNGAGKTTLLKILWYMVSPNVERAFSGFNFSRAKVETSLYTVELWKKPSLKCVFCPSDDGEAVIVSGEDYLLCNEDLLPNSISQYALERINEAIRMKRSSSMFFPTFRRIEVDSDDEDIDFSAVSAALSDVTRKVSVDDHKYVASFSTKDVERIVTTHYAEASFNLRREQTSFSRRIVDKVSQIINSIGDGSDSVCAASDLEDILRFKQEFERAEEDVFERFNKLSDAVSKVMKDKTIEISRGVSLGDGSKRLRASGLSAGEKQMLGFLTYNAFFEGTPMIVDEPELSLHADWQRILFPLLMGQKSSNQFIIATHSPFIYSRYPEKELDLGELNGCK